MTHENPLSLPLMPFKKFKIKKQSKPWKIARFVPIFKNGNKKQN
jgi:hypothetical protein